MVQARIEHTERLASVRPLPRILASYLCDDLSARRGLFAAEVPTGVGVLVAAVDVQGDLLEAVVKGYGAGRSRGSSRSRGSTASRRASTSGTNSTSSY